MEQDLSQAKLDEIEKKLKDLEEELSDLDESLKNASLDACRLDGRAFEAYCDAQFDDYERWSKEAEEYCSNWSKKEERRDEIIAEIKALENERRGDGAGPE
ncbi:MAG: hypothetical protein IH945_06245 [Armatimonadetes bacterium]|nr:hypothetical protein [Armatimonadota bacterium]